ncbi:hypothetical protein [Haliangium ochraceum]|nr:hypothetical protein [Haliangium ochraceum]
MRNRVRFSALQRAGVRLFPSTSSASKARAAGFACALIAALLLASCARKSPQQAPQGEDSAASSEPAAAAAVSASDTDEGGHDSDGDGETENAAEDSDGSEDEYPDDSLEPPVHTATPPGDGSVFWLRGMGEDQVEVLARVRGKRIESSHEAKSYERFRPGPGPLTRASMSDGEAGPIALTGDTRVQCLQALARVEGESEFGELLVAGKHRLQPRPVTEIEADRGALARLPAAYRDGDIDIAAFDSFDVYRADLDGDGRPEQIAALTAPYREEDQTTDFSIVSVSAGKRSHAVGHLARKEGEYEDTKQIEIRAIADLDGDGRMEVVTEYHEYGIHFHHLVIHAWNGRELQPLAEFRYGERDCYPADSWPASE